MKALSMKIDASVEAARPLAKLTLAVLLTGFLALVVANAWLCDDAYITFRTVDNFVHGYGLTWNVSERVQVYTHPLWMFVVAGAYAVTGEIYFTSLFISIAISLAAIYLVAVRGARTYVLAALALLVAGLSKASIDYTTSGLENPLTHLILAGFLLTYARDRANAVHDSANAAPDSATSGTALRSTFLLSLFAALGMLNRLDLALIFAPALLWRLVQRRSWKTLGVMALGFLPLVLWEIFALFYYGYPFPNTALAKLNAGLISQTELWQAGLLYLHNSLRVDPITLITIVAALALPLFARDLRQLPLALGMMAYVVYTARIGGDFMSGRFLTAPWIVGLFILVNTAWPKAYVGQIAVLIVLVLVGLWTPYTPFRASGGIRADKDESLWIWGKGVTDERANYYVNTGLMKALRTDKELPDHDWAMSGREAREERQEIEVRGSVGFYGYFAGPEVHVVDLLGLGDPLLSRLPVTDPKWRVGHYGRRPPEGYLETVRTGRNHIADPNLATYYDKLSYVIRGDLWDPARWLEIWKFNTGAYDHLLRAYAFFEGTTFVREFDVVNVSGEPFVYAYVWNNGAGEVFLLDSTSTEGEAYPVRWTISAAGVRFEGSYEEHVGSIGPLSDTEPLNVGVILTTEPDMSANTMYERRYWFRFEGEGRMTIVHPPLTWYNGPGPDDYWREIDADDVMRARHPLSQG